MRLLACELIALAGANQTSVKCLIKMKSKTLISKQAKRKLSPEIVSTILNTKKKSKWQEVAGVLASPRRNKFVLNLDEINEKAKEGEKVIIPGKVLGQGELKKKIKVVALAFSKSAEEKLNKGKTEFSTIKEEIKSNPDAKNLKVIR